jgi:hypothetical protein
MSGEKRSNGEHHGKQTVDLQTSFGFLDHDTIPLQALDNAKVGCDTKPANVVPIVIGRHNAKCRPLWTREVEHFKDVGDGVVKELPFSPWPPEMVDVAVHQKVAVTADHDVVGLAYSADLHVSFSLGFDDNPSLRPHVLYESLSLADLPCECFAQIVLNSDKVVFSDMLAVLDKIKEMLCVLGSGSQGIGAVFGSVVMSCASVTQARRLARGWGCELLESSFHNHKGRLSGKSEVE